MYVNSSVYQLLCIVYSYVGISHKFQLLCASTPMYIIYCIICICQILGISTSLFVNSYVMYGHSSVYQLLCMSIPSYVNSPV